MESWSRSRMALVLLTVSVILAACGGDGDGATPTTSAAGVTTTVGETPTTEAAATATTEAEQSDSVEDDGLAGVTTACVDASQAVAAAVTSYSTGIAGAMGGTLEDDELQQVTDQLQAMAEAAPDEIKADLEVMADEIGKFYTAWAEIGYTGGAAPTPDQIEQLEALNDVIDQDAYNEAADNLEAWFEANC